MKKRRYLSNKKRGHTVYDSLRKRKTATVLKNIMSENNDN